MLSRRLKKNLLAEILQYEQALYENMYSYRCLWPLRRRLQAFYSKTRWRMFFSLPVAIFVPLRGTQLWRLHTKPYKFEYNISSNISHTRYRTNLNLCETVWVFIFFFLFDSWLNLLNGFDDVWRWKPAVFLSVCARTCWFYLLFFCASIMLFLILWRVPPFINVFLFLRYIFLTY